MLFESLSQSFTVKHHTELHNKHDKGTQMQRHIQESLRKDRVHSSLRASGADSKTTETKLAF